MAAVCYVGDEVTAAGFRLAGVRAIAPGAGEESAAFAAAASGEAVLVLVCAALAARIPAHVLAQARASALVAIVPDLRERVPLPDLPARLRRELGLVTAG